MKSTETSDLLVALQQGLPLESQPFAALGNQFGLQESDVLSRVKALLDEGKARRMGGVFDVRRLGYRSALCAVSTDMEKMAERAAVISSRPGVTHCYYRGWPPELATDIAGAPSGAETPNLWFTLAERTALFDRSVEDMRAALYPLTLHVMPAVRRFKIDVVFHPQTRERGELFPGAAPRNSGSASAETQHVCAEFSAVEKRIIRLMQDSIPLCSRPFERIATRVGGTEEELLARLRTWEQTGVLRRVGIILRHQQMGFRANGMCTWRVDGGTVLEAGRKLASLASVTHCYERNPLPCFPFNLYAMIHAGSYGAAIERFQQLSGAIDNSTGRVLFSLREFKKTSPVYFPEADSLASEAGPAA